MSWRVAAPAPGLVDRRVEITGPTDKKMTINALNSGAKVWLADFEDANTPLWDNMVTGQLNLADALDRKIDFTSEDGKAYQLVPAEELATIVVRPRGWHLDEKHLLVDGQRVSGSLFDFGMYFAHCARRQLDAGKGPYFYLAKLESHLEARLWNDAFNLAQDALGIPRGTIRATVLIETIPAAFEMEEILYELRDHSAGLNAGRWDYQFSIIKKFRTRGREFLLPERNAVTMTAPFMRAYTELLVSTCHRPRRSRDGRDGRVHPEQARPGSQRQGAGQGPRRQGQGVAATASTAPGSPTRTWSRSAARYLTSVLGDAPNQLGKLRDDVHVTAADLLAIDKTPGEITEAGLRNNISVGLQYLANWLDRDRRRGHLQPDGGRGDCGDLPVADLAVAAQRRDPGRRPEGHHGAGRADHRRGNRSSQGAGRRGIRRGRVRAGRRAVQGGRAGRRLRRVPDDPGLRADALSLDRADRDESSVKMGRNSPRSRETPARWER